MDKRDIAAQAEKYRQELMKLYGRSTVPAVNTRIETEKPPVAPSEPEREMVTEPEEIVETPQDEARRQPEAPPAQAPQPVQDPPVMPAVREDQPMPESTYDENSRQDDFDRLRQRLEMIGREPSDDTPEYPSEESIGTARGYILVNVRTGDDSEPVENASIQVTAIVDGNRMILASGITDRSGIAPRFEVPAPDLSYSQAPDPAVRPYSLFDISVTADGFFNARSVDVPVFEGITSVQNFSMIPVPLFMRPGEETVTNYNQNTNL